MARPAAGPLSQTTEVENQTMKLANLFLSGLVVAAMGFTAIGCNENDPGTGPGDGTAPSAPSNVQATSLSANSVGLKWTASADTGAITYTVSWAPINSSTSTGSVDVAAGTTTATATNLTAGEYKFSVVAKRSGLSSTAATVNWAGATRYSNDAGATSTTIKMYETASSKGSGLTLDPSKGGPKNVSVGASNTVPNSVQLAIYTTSSDPSNFEIGPAYAFPEYKNADKFDQSVYISENSYVAQSLNEWYSTGMITVPANGNVRAFKFPVTETGSTGQGFYVRTGAAGDYHYARVFIKKSGGKLLQNDANGRYVELEISYQPTANLAYAKAAGRTPSPIGATSQVYHP